MNVTFFIGNGFDVSVGLKTRYLDFLVKYLGQSESNKTIINVKNVIAKEMNEDIKTWADLELGLGLFTKRYEQNAGQIDQFIIIYNHMVKSLSEYLKNVTENIDYSSHVRKISRSFRKAILNPFLDLPDAEQQIIKYAWDAHHDSPIDYQFVSFNYTSVFDHCLKNACKSKTMTQGRTSNLKNGPDVFHIHGTLNDAMILGVDNEEQIVNPYFRDKALIRDFIKPYANEDLSAKRNDQMIEMIDRSHFIIIFGMSLGETDQTWWQCIGRWLHAYTNHHLVVYTYDPECNPVVGHNCALKIRETKNKMKGYILPEDREREMSSQIHVIVNRDLFNLKLA